MLSNTFNEDRSWLEKKFQQDVCQDGDGIEDAQLKQEIDALIASMGDIAPALFKARVFDLAADKLKIDVSEHDFFPTFACFSRSSNPNEPFTRPTLPVCIKLGSRVWKEHINVDPDWPEEKYGRIDKCFGQFNDAAASALWLDFCHSVPQWDRLLTMGFSGVLEDVKKYHAAKQPLSEEEDNFYTAIEITYNAILRNMARLEACARRHGGPRQLFVADAIHQLRIGIPRNFYEVLLANYLYFIYCEYFDEMQVRSLGNLDRMLLPYFEKDLKDGTFTEEEMRLFFDYYLMQFASINNYWGHPFYLGSTNADGTSGVNHLSYLILEEFDKLHITSPKIQLKVAQNTPDEWIDTALKIIRRGNSSLVFVGEEGMTRAMLKLGYTKEDARTCDMVGCYEFYCAGEHHENTTGGGHINLLKVMDWLWCGKAENFGTFAPYLHLAPLAQLDTFDKFYDEFCRIVKLLINWNIEILNIAERYLQYGNPANVHSAMVKSSLETARDGFAQGNIHNNTTLLFNGFASAVDALSAIREFVYEKKLVSLQELAKILLNNWQGAEELRQQALHSPNKWGNDVEAVDELAAKLATFLSSSVNGRPNGRGGLWKASAHAARQFIELGAHTGASADGRLAGEETSKNYSPVMGMDRNGVTALLNSAKHLDITMFPGDFPLDVMLHPSSVSGDDGLNAWRALIRIYMKNGGHAIHFNVFDTEQLKEAQRTPEKYSGLQVRVCGWSVRFVTLDKTEQDMYIRRAENIK